MSERIGDAGFAMGKTFVREFSSFDIVNDSNLRERDGPKLGDGLWMDAAAGGGRSLGVTDYRR